MSTFRQPVASVWYDAFMSGVRDAFLRRHPLVYIFEVPNSGFDARAAAYSSWITLCGGGFSVTLTLPGIWDEGVGYIGVTRVFSHMLVEAWQR